jgi:hypothetical protein
MNIIEELKTIRKMADTDIQGAMDKLVDCAIFLEDECIVEPDENIWGKYARGMDIISKGITKRDDLYLNYEYFYEYKRIKKDVTLVEEITKESIINTVMEFESALKVVR